ncbi:MAG TPA: ATP-binding cassette domain-containing protein [Polyangiales bacterium]|nr:ATP-binding cassette domain-containing protein [Polyangiales bacterium]
MKRVRFIPQLEVAECGAAALAMVLDYHGCAVPLAEVRAACGISRDGSSAAAITRAARDYGLAPRGLKLPPQKLATLPMPAILHWEFSHFVVLESLGRNGAQLVDPARGRRRVSLRELSESFTGVALAFEPTPALAPRKRAAGSWARCLSVLAREQKALRYVMLAALLLEPLAVLFPAATQVIVDQVIAPQRTSWLLPIAIALSAALLVRYSLEWLRDRVSLGLQTALDLSLSADFVGHLVRLPPTFFAQRSEGELIERVEANRELRDILASLVLGLLDALLLLGYGALMVAYDPGLGALALLVSVTRMGWLSIFRARIRRGAANLLALQGRETGAVVDALAAPEMTRALAAESVFAARYAYRLRERLGAEVELKNAALSAMSGTHVFDGLGLALVLWLGGARVLSGELTVGVFAGFIALQGLIDKPLGALFHCMDRYFHAQGILERLDDVLRCKPMSRGGRKLSTLRGELRFEDVGFRHGPNAPWLFRKLSFTIQPGEKVALVGRSGQGKSTVLKLLTGALQPTEGRIWLDDVPLDELDREALARKLGVVLQEPFLLDESVAANLRLRCPDARQEDLEAAARTACIHDVISELPEGYRTRIANESLSGGQRQRLCIARALVGRPALLLLDEATSSLDLETERELHGKLRVLGSTRVLVAHRLATVRDAQRIFVLEGGTLAQVGSYVELAAVPGPFRALMEAACA